MFRSKGHQRSLEGGMGSRRYDRQYEDSQALGSSGYGGGGGGYGGGGSSIQLDLCQLLLLGAVAAAAAAAAAAAVLVIQGKRRKRSLGEVLGLADIIQGRSHL